jgi:hypothetical protein
MMPVGGGIMRDLSFSITATFTNLTWPNDVAGAYPHLSIVSFNVAPNVEQFCTNSTLETL